MIIGAIGDASAYSAWGRGLILRARLHFPLDGRSVWACICQRDSKAGGGEWGGGGCVNLFNDHELL